MNDYQEQAINDYNDSAEAKGHDRIPTLDQIDDYRKEQKESGDGVLRWVWRLECGHSLLADDAPKYTPPSFKNEREWCPDCGMDFRIIETFLYRDKDLAEYSPVEERRQVAETVLKDIENPTVQALVDEVVRLRERLREAGVSVSD